MTEDLAKSTDDWSALKKAAKGDTTAFKELFDRTSLELLKFLASRLGKSHADDALGDVWLKAWRAISKGQYTETHFRGWIFQIARNVIRDRIRKHSSGPESLEHEETISDSSQAPHLIFELKQRNDDFRDCLSLLKSKYHEYASVVVAHLEGNDHETIAAELKIPLGTSHSRLAKAKKGLMQCMQHKGWTD